MSWSGFKKNVGRATTQVMMKTGQVEKTSDRQYEIEERRYRTLESASLRLQKEAKGYLDSLRAMTASQMRIAETIDAFYGESGAQDGVSRSYKQAVEDLDAETIKALDGPYRFVDPSLRKLAVDEGGEYGASIIQEIEKEMNSKHARSAVWVEVFHRFETESQLLGDVYRTTVLEPINRFCAYFPDINECIKKRNNKMLDYDSLRSKVKKLTEKPDKDASKLPRAEKEADLVSGKTFLVEAAHSSPRSSFSTRGRPMSTDDEDLPRYDVQDLEADLQRELKIPSPPKALQRPEIMKLRCGDSFRRSISLRSPLNGGAALSATRRASERHNEIETPLQQGSSPASVLEQDEPNLHSWATHGGLSLGSGLCTEQPAPLDSHSAAAPFRAEGFDAARVQKRPSRSSITDTALTPSPSAPSHHRSPSFFKRHFPKHSTPFFEPSELEEILHPLKLEYLYREANKAAQAKAGYEQLNEQLTNEIPQLIDLRVPYLDPSFEALVKIQLRFCSEAYSRMAQVQQYLDPSTRNQYANGELDGRVEEVLNQIRDLSIAGTV